ncbi:hypothetical protein Tco_0325390, partial [Tanacetum coccineum]
MNPCGVNDTPMHPRGGGGEEVDEDDDGGSGVVVGGAWRMAASGIVDR